MNILGNLLAKQLHGVLVPVVVRCIAVECLCG
jgi:hypothetical protein